MCTLQLCEQQSEGGRETAQQLQGKGRASTGKACVDSASHLVWGLLIVLALVVVNAFFVAAEYALVRVRRTRMEALAASPFNMLIFAQ
jgi:hypothetical protein